MLKKLFKHEPQFAPDLIDLIQYEKNLLYNREYRKQPIPVRPIPAGRTWSESELQVMRDNRSQAQAIKERIFGSDQ